MRSPYGMACLFPALQARPVVKSAEYKSVVHETVVNDAEDYETLEYETVVCELSEAKKKILQKWLILSKISNRPPLQSREMG